MTYEGFKQNVMMARRSIVYRHRQYASLFAVCIIGICVSLFGIFLVRGMVQSLRGKARIYYGGDYVFMGGVDEANFQQFEPELIVDKLKTVFDKNAKISIRFDKDARNASLYYNGKSSLLKTIKGIDFSDEEDLLSEFNYTSGSYKNAGEAGDVLISENIARQLGIKVGDTISLMIEDYNDFLNTTQCTVKAVFLDSSVFGMYTVYMDRKSLNKVYGFPESQADRFCIRFPGSTGRVREAQALQTKLEGLFKMHELVKDKDSYYDDMKSDEPFSESIFALIPLTANLQEVQFLIDAMRTISLFVIVILVTIIAAGISSTYRVLIMKRITEIGTYKAIGMTRRRLIGMITQEVLIMILAGCAGGFILAVLISYLSGFIDLSFIPAFDMFLTNGRLNPDISLLHVAVIGIVVGVTTLLSVLFSVRNALAISPAQALAVTE